MGKKIFHRDDQKPLTKEQWVKIVTREKELEESGKKKVSDICYIECIECPFNVRCNNLILDGNLRMEKEERGARQAADIILKDETDKLNIRKNIKLVESL